MEAKKIAGKKLVFASILRAGNGLLEGMLDLVPSARVAHIGIYRDHKTLQPVEYYFKAPEDLAERTVICVDPMLATANSSVAAVDKLKSRGAKDIRFVCLLAAPEGIKHFRDVASRRADLHRRDRQPSERAGLHRAGPGRCRRPDVRDEVRRACSFSLREKVAAKQPDEGLHARTVDTRQTPQPLTRHFATPSPSGRGSIVNCA